jgi:PAS domain S-box-containing protein
LRTHAGECDNSSSDLVETGTTTQKYCLWAGALASTSSVNERNDQLPGMRPWEGFLRDLSIYVACGLSYFAVALISLFYFATHETPAAIWPATGLLIAFMIILPKRLWLGILVIAFAAGTAGNFATGKPLPLSLGLGVVDAIEGLVSGVLLVNFVGPQIRFTRLRELTGLVLFSAVLGNGVSALVGAGVFKLFAHSPYWYSWRLWWLSNGIGILTLTPCVVSWSSVRARWRYLSAIRKAEAFLLLLVLTTVSVAIFGGRSWSSMSLPYLVFPLLIWAALRFGVQGASGAAVALATVAVWYTDQGFGPFAVVAGSVVEKLLQVQSFIAAALACSLVPALVIVERREAEEKLRRSEAGLELAQEIAGVGSFVLDPAGVGPRWSEQMFRIMGREPAAGAPSYGEFLTWVHPEDRERVQTSYDRIFRFGKSFEIDFRYICPDGSWRQLHSIARPEIDDRTKSITAFGTVMDLTDRKRIEEQLRQAQKMEAIGRLAGGVAHDFNNLLGVILGYTELALGELRADDPLRSKIEPISKAAVRAASLTSQLLAFSRRQVLKPEELDLNRVVTDLEPMLTRLIGTEIEIVTDLHSPLPLVKADPGQMDQVIMNLAVNSRDAMSGGGKLRMRTSRFFCRTTPGGYTGKIAPGEYVMLTVTDTGHGMDATTRAHIFEPFFTTKPKGKGTGLGLSTVYGIVSQSNGHIWAESEVGKGTDIHIVLPIVKGTATAAAANVVTQVRKQTVLLVEDEAPLRELVVQLVSSMGCTALEAPTADAALALARGPGEIDVLLTDVVMPNMDGFELAKKIAEMRPHIKVLYMSGYSDEVLARRHNEENLNFLQKPFQPADLIKKLQEVMDAPPAAKLETRN